MKRSGNLKKAMKQPPGLDKYEAEEVLEFDGEGAFDFLAEDQARFNREFPEQARAAGMPPLPDKAA